MVKFFRRVNGSIKWRLKNYLGIVHNSKSLYTKDFLIDNKYCEIGEFTYGHPRINSWGEGTYLKIGKFCSIAYNVEIFLGGNHRTDWVSTYPFNILNNSFPNAVGINGHPFSKGDVIIGNDVWIGQNSVILSGIKIGDGAVIGANSVVTKNVEPYSIVAGNPAKLIKKRFTDDQINSLEKIEWWNWPIEKINENIPLMCSEKIEVFIEKNRNI